MTYTLKNDEAALVYSPTEGFYFIMPEQRNSKDTVHEQVAFLAAVHVKLGEVDDYPHQFILENYPELASKRFRKDGKP